MPSPGKPRSGSMQFWPRKRANRIYARVRHWAESKDAKPLGFAGYKVGMTHMIVIDNGPNSLTKNEEISIPVTLIECPPMKVFSARFYKKEGYASRVVSEVLAEKLDKELERKITMPKKSKKFDDVKDFDDIKITLYTQPKLTGIGKKKPDMIELALGGSKEEKLNFVKENLGKEINIDNVFQPGNQIDIHAVTKGKGFQGPVKRFGVHLRSHKSEKVIRGPGSLGAWNAQGHIMWRVAHAGQMGFHQRTEYNKWIMKISKGEEVKVKGGFIRFGVIKNPFIAVKGSIAGPAKRIIIFTKAQRPNKKLSANVPEIKYLSLESKQ